MNNTSVCDTSDLALLTRSLAGRSDVESGPPRNSYRPRADSEGSSVRSSHTSPPVWRSHPVMFVYVTMYKENIHQFICKHLRTIYTQVQELFEELQKKDCLQNEYLVSTCYYMQFQKQTELNVTNVIDDLLAVLSTQDVTRASPCIKAYQRNLMIIKHIHTIESENKLICIATQVQKLISITVVINQKRNVYYIKSYDLDQ